MPDFAVVRPVKHPGETGLGRLIPGRVWDLAVLAGGCRKRRGQTYCLDSDNVVKGHVIECPFPRQKSLSRYEKKVMNHLVGAGRLAERLGAEVIGFDRRICYAIDLDLEIAPNLKIPIISGDLLLAEGLLEALRQALVKRGQSLEKTRAVVVSWRHPLVKLFAELLARDCRELVVWDQPNQSIDLWLAQVLYNTGAVCRRSTDLTRALIQADVVLLGDMSAGPVEFNPDACHPEAIVVDLFPWLNQPLISQSISSRRVLAEPVFSRRSANYETGETNCLDSLEAELVLASLGRTTANRATREFRLEQVADVQRLARQQGFTLAGCSGWERKEVLDKE